MARLEGKVAIVTGAARGTGAATARLFAREGARVVLADVLDEAGEAVAKEIGSTAVYQHLDVTREADWERGVARTLEAFGSLDTLVNNAAVLQVEALEQTSYDDFVRVLMVNQVGPFLGIRAAVEPMRAAGGGSIINISSIDGLEGMNGVAAYGSSKWGLRGLTKVAALELGKHGIRVNTLCPGTGSFEMIEPFVKAAVERAQAAAARGEQPPSGNVSHQVLPGRVSMENAAEVILFLASDASAGCTGGDFAVDGGYTAGKRIPGAPGY